MIKTVLVTGGAGYVGSHTCYLLQQAGMEVISVDLQEAKHSFFQEHFVGNFADEVLLTSIFQKYSIQCVFHLAAWLDVHESTHDANKYYVNNISNTIRLLSFMLSAGCLNFVMSSTCATLGSPSAEELPVTEETPPRPESVYGKSKLLSEMILEDYHRIHGLNYASLRYFNVAGATPEHMLGDLNNCELHLIPVVVGRATSGKPFSIFGSDYDTRDGTCVRDYLHPMDVADAHVRCCQYFDQGGESGVFLLSTGTGLTVAEVVDSVERIYEAKIDVHYAPRREGDACAIYGNPAKAKRLLGWEPKHSDIDNIIRTELEYHRKRQEQQESSV